jgi:hypothetical protein
VSYVLNNLLFALPDFQCGCRCSAYTTPDGFQTFSVSDVRSRLFAVHARLLTR